MRSACGLLALIGVLGWWSAYLDDTISELATRRSKFSAILRAQGTDGLIAALNKKADELV